MYNRTDFHRLGCSLFAIEKHVADSDLVGRIFRAQERDPIIDSRRVLPLALVVSLILERLERLIATIPDDDPKIGRPGPGVWLGRSRLGKRTSPGLERRDQEKEGCAPHGTTAKK